MVGSSFVRGLHKLPQLPPKNPKAIAKAKPQLKELPTCPHEVRLTQTDFDLYQRVYAGRDHLLWGNTVLPDGSNVGPHPYQAKACPECTPTCAHGEQLTPKEIAAAKESGKRRSSECPVCVGSTDAKKWNQFMNRIGYGMYRGMNPADLYISTLEGGLHALGQRKTVALGSSAQIEEVDAQSPVARDDISARAINTKETENEEE